MSLAFRFRVWGVFWELGGWFGVSGLGTFNAHLQRLRWVLILSSGEVWLCSRYCWQIQRKNWVHYPDGLEHRMGVRGHLLVLSQLLALLEHTVLLFPLLTRLEPCLHIPISNHLRFLLRMLHTQRIVQPLQNVYLLLKRFLNLLSLFCVSRFHLT